MIGVEPRFPDIDFAADEIPDLHEILARLREEGPVSPIVFAGETIWLVNDYETVKRIIADDTILSAPLAYHDLFAPTMGRGIPTLTGREHQLNRAVVSKVFFPSKVRQLAATLFTEEANRLADEIERHETIDLIPAFTRAYTFNNIAGMLGLPREDVEKLQDWADRIMRCFIDLEAASAAGTEMGDYLSPMIRKRRAEPGDDIISLLTQAEVDGQTLDDEAVLAFCRNLFPAAIDTSTNSLGSLIAYTLRDHALWQALPRDRKLRDATVEEALRWEPPLIMVPRRCVQTIELGGHTLNVGDDVRMCIAGANDDPRHFANPREFDIERESSSLTFGYGEHFCLGAQMARRVLETGIQTLTERFPEMALCEDEKAEIVGGVLRGPKSLRVRPQPARE